MKLGEFDQTVTTHGSLASLVWPLIVGFGVMVLDIAQRNEGYRNQREVGVGRLTLQPSLLRSGFLYGIPQPRPRQDTAPRSLIRHAIGTLVSLHDVTTS